MRWLCRSSKSALRAYQGFGDVRPGVPAICGLEKAAGRAAALLVPRVRHMVVQGSDDHVRVPTIDRQVHGAGGLLFSTGILANYNCTAQLGDYQPRIQIM